MHADQIFCDACNAEPGEKCACSCIGLAAEIDRLELLLVEV